MPTPKGHSVLTWSRLASALQKAPTGLWICLGACDSASVALAWTKLPEDFPVSIVLGFRSDRTNTSEVEDSLLTLLDATGCYTPGSEQRRSKESITTIEEDIASFETYSNRLVVFRRNPHPGSYDVVHAECDESTSSESLLPAEIPESLVEELLGDSDDGETKIVSLS